MSVVDHFIDGFLGLTDCRKLKIGQMFSFLKFFFLGGGMDHFFKKVLIEFVTVLLLLFLSWDYFWP